MEQEKIRLLQQEQLAKEQLQTQIMQGSAELASFGSKITDWSQPDVARGLYELAIKSPIITKTEGWKGMMDMHQTAVNAKNQLAKDAKTADIWALEQADEWERQANTWESVNPERAKQFRTNAALLRSKFTSPTETIETSVDEQGRPSVRITRGPDAGKAGIGGAARTMVDKQMIGMENSMELLGDLSTNLRQEDLGIRGVIGENVMDRLLPQFGFKTQDLERADNRTKLKAAIQGMVRLISSDDRFSNEDRKRAEDVMVSPGWNEDIGRAKVAISTLQEIFRNRARVNANATKQPVPAWALNATDIATKVQAGELTREQALELMRKYGIKE